jgi:hypothetical protein
MYLMKKNRGKFPTQFNLRPYEGKNEDHGVIEYAIDDTFIILKFKERTWDGRQIYLYNYDRPGKLHVEEMKKHAKDNEGLTTYKNQNVKDNYAAYWDEDSKKFKRKDNKGLGCSSLSRYGSTRTR